MSSYVHCDGCGANVPPEESEEWIQLFIPLPRDVSSDPMQDMMAQIMGKQKQRYESLTFCTLKCVVTGALIRDTLLSEKF